MKVKEWSFLPSGSIRWDLDEKYLAEFFADQCKTIWEQQNSVLRALQSLKWETPEVKEVWFRLFIQIPQTTQGFTSRESKHWLLCPRCDTQSVTGNSKQEHNGIYWEEPSEEQTCWGVQSFTLCTALLEVLLQQVLVGSFPSSSPSSHGKSSQETLSCLGVSLWAVDDPFRVCFWPVAQTMSSSFGFMLFLPVTSQPAPESSFLNPADIPCTG